MAATAWGPVQQIEAGVLDVAAPDLERLNKGVFVSVGGRRSAGVNYETYLVE